ncbi:MAG TPA: response regulator [Candidatus Obscuribacterales bacterium]
MDDSEKVDLLGCGLKPIILVKVMLNRANNAPASRILIVDDVPENLELLYHVLTDAGYEVDTVLDGEAALEQINRDSPELILLDIMMPGLNGYELCQQLKACPQTRDIPVIFISALAEINNKVKGFQVGGVDYITKPFEIEDVLVRVKNQLTIVEQQKQLQEQKAQLEKEIQERRRVETALQQSIKREKTSARVIQRMRETLNLNKIFKSTTVELRKVLHCDRVVIYQFNPDWSGKFVAESVETGWFPLIKAQYQDPVMVQTAILNSDCVFESLTATSEIVVEDTYLQETQGGVYRRGVTYRSVENIYQSEFSPCYINFLERFQVKSYLTVAIFCANQLWGLLGAYQSSNFRKWHHIEISMVVQIASQLGVAVHQAQLFTKIQEQTEELKIAKKAAESANAAKSQFLANMSHELRTPLNAILGFAQIMKNDHSLLAEQQKHIEIINRSGEHLLDLINDVLELSKIEAGKITLSETRFDLLILIDNIKDMLRLKAESKGLLFEFDISYTVPQYIITDERKLRQILANLLGNAIKFTETGSVKLRVSAGFKPPSENKESDQDTNGFSPLNFHPGLQEIPENQKINLKFEIEDTGAGISPEELPLLFEAFTQTEVGRQSGQGTGLGLPISRHFVQLMGGDIQVQSIPEQGSTFTFEIQARIDRETNLHPGQNQQQIIHLAPDQNPVRILIVDDDADNRSLLVKMLDRIGFQVQEAGDGQEALELWESWQPDLICLDMQLPILDGFAMARQIRSQEQQRSIPILAITASVFDRERQSISVSGCNDWITKPFKEEVLLEKIREHLGVEYVYEESYLSYTTLPKITTSLVSSALKNQLLMLPDSLIEELHHAATQCSDDLVLQLIDEIPEEFLELSQVIQEWVLNFRFDLIIDLTHQIQSSKQ